MSKPTLPALALSLLPLAAHADELHVPSQYPTIQAAIEAAAQQGDDIFIAPGTYREHLNGLNKSLTFIGAGATQTILSADLDNDGAPDGDILTYDNHDGDLAPFITITGITFKEANTAFTIGLAGDITIAACRFEACEDTAVYVSRNLRDLHIIDSVFVDGRTHLNIRGFARDVVFAQCEFSNLTDSPIYVRSESLAVRDSSFTQNTGGGIDVSARNGSIQGCLFEGNTTYSSSLNYICAKISYGDFLIDNCTFKNNGLGPESSSGTLGISGDFTIQNCSFYNNQGEFGSAISASGEFVIQGCAFENNTGSTTGPINCGSNGGLSLISNCQFINNESVQSDVRSGSYGGGLCVEDGNVKVDDCLFRGNTATSGGAIVSYGELWVNRCRFEANLATHQRNGSGGAITATSHLGVTNSVFIGNHAQNSGGGAISSMIKPLISNSVFMDNTSNYGSVVLRQTYRSRTIQDSAARHISLSACIIVPTSDTNSHFAFGTAQTPVDLTNNIFTTDPASIGFSRIPHNGGDGWGDDPTTPLIDEGLNDDFGDLTLLPNSPAIDAGKNASLPIDIYDLNDNGDETDFLIGTTDLAGNPRFVDVWNIQNAHTPGAFVGPIDIGPIEFQADPCPADVNHDLALTPADFTAWIAAYNTNAPECDQNGDNWCSVWDFNAWLESYNAGCQ